MTKIIYYFEDCPTCKNHNRILIRQAALAKKTLEGVDVIDERYILALPAIWGKQVEEIGADLPFLYNPETKEALHIDYTKESMLDEINTFLGTSQREKLV